MRRRLATALATTTLSLATVVATASAAGAAPADKPQVLASWTQTSASSYNAWAAARANQGAWAAYGFDWSTDYCSSSPDNPFGFPFASSCARHDFGYRNYKAAGSFDANKARLDSAFYEDLKRVCNNYSGSTKTACNSTAWTYYQAVRAFG
ncbi:phospholipase [Streptomyces spinoverrucosus]|uniref:phospholipase n=1 Tax=Streptomyces spinoverrucosus TaxID=284043 RepID=UPI0018C39BC3|nr:phospholipase [Streptomyces spinoverrucosus]MBG0854503.1 phospholipase [Streptomyces spinoverrucosus]